MLTSNDYNHIKLLYEQLYKMNRYINKLMNENDWESVQSSVSDKEKLINKIVAFEKIHVLDIKQTPELNELRLNLASLEKENIKLATSIKQGALQDLHLIKQAKKVFNAYEPVSNESVSTFEVTND